MSIAEVMFSKTNIWRNDGVVSCLLRFAFVKKQMVTWKS